MGYLLCVKLVGRLGGVVNSRWSGGICMFTYGVRG
jgi:hypothetical protein